MEIRGFLEGMGRLEKAMLSALIIGCASLVYYVGNLAIDCKYRDDIPSANFEYQMGMIEHCRQMRRAAVMRKSDERTQEILNALNERFKNIPEGQ